MSHRPILTVAQYQERTRQLRVEVANIAWSLVVSPDSADRPHCWRALSPDDSLDVFDRLMRAVTRHAVTDRARIVERLR